jgi:hypothetical protein
MRRSLALLTALLALPLAAHAATYRWVDDNGRVHYGDAPPPAAREVRQLDEAAGRVSTIEAVPADQLQRDRERALQARLDRLEREIDDLRRAPAVVPVPVPVQAPVYTGAVWGAPFAVAPVRFRPPFRAVHAPRPLPPRGGVRVVVRR